MYDLLGHFGAPEATKASEDQMLRRFRRSSPSERGLGSGGLRSRIEFPDDQPLKTRPTVRPD